VGELAFANPVALQCLLPLATSACTPTPGVTASPTHAGLAAFAVALCLDSAAATQNNSAQPVSQHMPVIYFPSSLPCFVDFLPLFFPLFFFFSRLSCPCDKFLRTEGT
jgi:hypothetical protein